MQPRRAQGRGLTASIWRNRTIQAFENRCQNAETCHRRVRKRIGQALRWADGNSKRLKTIAIVLFLAVLIVGLLHRNVQQKAPIENGLESAKLNITKVTPESQAGHPVIYGSIYVDKFYDLDTSQRTFTADGSFWLEWPASVQEIINQNNIAIASMVRLKNRIESWGSALTPDTTKPIELSAGRFQQRFTFSSRFYDDTINFRRDPFNALTLPIIVELMPEIMTSKYNDVLLLAEKNQGALLGESGSISGYELSNIHLQSYQQSYRNKFGSWHAPKRSQLRLEVVYHSNVWSAFINWVLPLLIINCIVLIAPCVEGSLRDVRLAVPPTALLTLIFLQESYHGQLPRLPYTTLLDDLFSCSYVIAMALFVLFTWSANAYAKTPESLKEKVMKKIDRVDLVFQKVAAAALISTATIGWFFK